MKTATATLARGNSQLSNPNCQLSQQQHTVCRIQYGVGYSPQLAIGSCWLFVSWQLAVVGYSPVGIWQLSVIGQLAFGSCQLLVSWQLAVGNWSVPCHLAIGSWRLLVSWQFLVICHLTVGSCLSVVIWHLAFAQRAVTKTLHTATSK